MLQIKRVEDEEPETDAKARRTGKKARKSEAPVPETHKEKAEESARAPKTAKGAKKGKPPKGG